MTSNRQHRRFYFGTIVTISMDNFIRYIKATRAEMRHVSWPTQRQTIIYAALVIAISVLVSVFIFIFDQLFITGLGFIGISL